MTFEEQVKSNCGNLPIDRIDISRFDKLELAGIPRGVLFIFATWSGAAICSFRLFSEALAKTPSATFPVFVIDADGFDHEAFKSAFGELPQGKGEAYWIRHGQVVYRDSGYIHATKDVIPRRIQEFA